MTQNLRVGWEGRHRRVAIVILVAATAHVGEILALLVLLALLALLALHGTCTSARECKKYVFFLVESSLLLRVH